MFYLNLLNDLRKKEKKNTRLASIFISFFATSTNFRFYLSYDIMVRGDRG